MLQLHYNGWGDRLPAPYWGLHCAGLRRAEEDNADGAVYEPNLQGDADGHQDVEVHRLPHRLLD